MTSKITRISLKPIVTLTACALMMGAALSAPAFAQETGAQEIGEQDRESRQFGSAAGEIVNETTSLINGYDHSAVLSKLDEALALPDLNVYERSTIHQMQGSSYYELDQYELAIAAFEKAIEAGGLLPNEVSRLRLNIAQLLIASGRNTEGAQMLEDYINAGNPVGPAYIDMLVGAGLQAKDYEGVLPWAERWFEKANPKQRKHYDLLNFLYSNLGMLDKQVEILAQMLVQYPEDAGIWQVLVTTLTDQGKTQEAFGFYKMQYLSGEIRGEKSLLELVQIYSDNGMPFQAAQILEREMDASNITMSMENLNWLADLFTQAREYDRSYAVRERIAIVFPSADNYAALGEVAYRAGRGLDSETAWLHAIEMGYHDTSKAWYYIGLTRYELSQAAERIHCRWSEAEKLSSARMLSMEKP